MLEFFIGETFQNFIAFALASWNAGFNFYPAPTQIVAENEAYLQNRVDTVLTNIDVFVSDLFKRFRK